VAMLALAAVILAVEAFLKYSVRIWDTILLPVVLQGMQRMQGPQEMRRAAARAPCPVSVIWSIWCNAREPAWRVFDALDQPVADPVAEECASVPKAKTLAEHLAQVPRVTPRSELVHFSLERAVFTERYMDHTYAPPTWESDN